MARGTGAYFSQSGSSIYSGAAGVGAYFSQSGSSIFSGAAGLDDIFESDDYGDPPKFMPDHTVTGCSGERRNGSLGLDEGAAILGVGVVWAVAVVAVPLGLGFLAYKLLKK